MKQARIAAELTDRLREGKTLDEIAKAQAKSPAEVKKAVEDGVKQRLDTAVGKGELTRAQADDMASHVSDMLDHLGRFPKPPPPLWR